LTDIAILATIPVVMMFSLISYFIVLTCTPLYRDMLVRGGSVVRDVNKAIATRVARPVSLPIFVGLLASMSLLYISFQNDAILALIGVATLAYLIGYLDDIRTQKGWYKPVMLLSCGLVIVFFNTFHNSLIFPFVGLVEIPHMAYLVLMIPIISIIANTVNSIDVVNGAVSGAMTVAGFSLAIVLLVMGNYQMGIIAFPLGMVSYAFYRYHKVPATAFLGDSGTLLLGAVFAVIAIAGNVEVFAFIILTPMVLNSFLFLASVRKIVEHREIKNAAVVHDEEFRMVDSKLKGAPITLVRLLLRRGPKTEQQVSDRIITLMTISSSIAIVMAYFT